MPPRLITEPVLTVAEQIVRQIYFRSETIQRWRAARTGAPPRRDLSLSALQLAVDAHGVRRGDVLMVHSALSKITVVDDRDGREAVRAADPPTGAALILDVLRGIIGGEGTLVLPTFPKYPTEAAYLSPENDGRERLTYDPERTPSKSGLMTEIFRKATGSLRSRYPIQTVSASGRLAAEIVGGDATTVIGLAHGPGSPYARLVAHRAWVISIGIPLIDFCTVVHAAEDARYHEWPLKDFWRSRHFDVIEGERAHPVTLLERRPIYSRGYAEELLRRDARSNGVLAERDVGNVQCHALRADDLFNLMMERNAGTTYPFLWPAVSRL